MISREKAAEFVLTRAEASEALGMSRPAFQYHLNQGTYRPLKVVKPKRNAVRTIDLFWKPDLIEGLDYTPEEKEEAMENVLLRAEALEFLDMSSQNFRSNQKYFSVLKEYQPPENQKRSTKLYWKPDLIEYKEARKFFRRKNDT